MKNAQQFFIIYVSTKRKKAKWRRNRKTNKQVIADKFEEIKRERKKRMFVIEKTRKRWERKIIVTEILQLQINSRSEKERKRMNRIKKH